MAASRPAPPPPSRKTDSAPRRYRGGDTFLEPDGYVSEWCPTHPRARHGVVLQHRLEMEIHLGRFLTKNERVHHKNHVRHDNRIENLELMDSHSSHMKQHWQSAGRRDPEVIALVRRAAADTTFCVADIGLSPTTIALICRENGIRWKRRGAAVELTDALVKQALQGRSTLEAAAFLRVHPQRLYKDFDHLLSKRSSPGGLLSHRSDVAKMIQAGKTRDEIAEHFGVSRVTVIKAIRTWIAQGAKPGEFASRIRVPKNRTPSSQRKAPSRA